MRIRTHHVATPPVGQLRGQSVFPAMCRAREANDDRNMAIFLIEVHIPDAGASELELAVGLLVAARLRMRGPASVAQAILTGFSRVDAGSSA